MPPLPTPEELETVLWRSLLDRWFPACLDPAGGYRQNFDAAFRPTGDASKGLVFQARMVWVCATVAANRPEYAAYARHGVRFLKARLLDRRTGAFAWATDASDVRHAYGLAFAVYGLAAAARRLGDEEALELAQGACAYLEAHHRDEAHGGYFEATTPAGEPILSGDGADAIGTPWGQKSQNTHLHLLEAYTELVRAWPDPLVRDRLDGLLSLFAGHAPPLFIPGRTPATGHLALFAHRDWTPASRETSYGHDIEATHLILDAADVVATDEPHASRANDPQTDPLGFARSLADNVLAEGWDPEEGGVFNLGDARGPTDRRKVWWVQAEALLGFAALWRHTGEARYAEALARQWAFVRERHLDREHGGWIEEAGRPEMPKGHAWKAAYHDGRALLFAARLLGEAAGKG